MTSELAPIDFKNGNKNNWRRWAWNQVAQRVANRRDGIVLYLAGPDDLDRKVALEKGFHANNLIAVEKDKAVLASLRSRGVLAIDGTLQQCMHDWPVKRPVAAVIGDFYCGLEAKLISDLWHFSFFPPFMQSVFVFNFMRGRDPSTNGLRAAVHQNAVGAEAKNRAHAYWLAAVREVFVRLKEAQPTEWADWKLDGLREQMTNHAAPAFRTYKSSSGQFFDSLAMNPMVPATSMGEAFDPGSRSAQRRRIAAVLAHRTMRA